MGTVRAAPAHTSTMLDALFPATRQRVLGLLFGQPQRAFAMRSDRSGEGWIRCGPAEVERLSASGLVVVDGEPRRIRARTRRPLFVELTGIREDRRGGGALQRVLAPMAGQIYFAILYGSVAKGSDRATSDVDVLIVTDALTLEEVFAALAGAEQRLGRAVNPTLYTAAEYHRRRKAKHPFLTKVLGGKHVVLLGSEDAIPAG
jgi:predicted nucleotidyltransferase